jgi:predicted enzyme related to lactoylglutathione lyase
MLAVVSTGQITNATQETHGIFTGDIKAVFYVVDVEKSAPFYRDVLGFDFLEFANLDGQPYYAEMSAAGVKFGLHEAVSPGQSSKIGQQRLYFRVKDLFAHRSRAQELGGKPSEIVETDWMDMFMVRDPDGNEIIFAVTDSVKHPIDPWIDGER